MHLSTTCRILMTPVTEVCLAFKPKGSHRLLWEKTMEDKREEEREKKCLEEEDGGGEHPLPLMALNHVSRLCRSVPDSIEFYTKVLGFVLVKRPQAFDFDGAWLFNYGVGIHLLQAKDESRLPDADHLDPMDNHVSFQCEDMKAMEEKLKEKNIKYMKRTVEDEGGASIDQLFFNDPDGFMIEICNCENLKLVPAGSLGRIKLPLDRHNPTVELNEENDEQFTANVKAEVKQQRHLQVKIS